MSIVFSEFVLLVFSCFGSFLIILISGIYLDAIWAADLGAFLGI
jgi:hypothetical protein